MIQEDFQKAGNKPTKDKTLNRKFSVLLLFFTNLFSQNGISPVGDRGRRGNPAVDFLASRIWSNWVVKAGCSFHGRVSTNPNPTDGSILECVVFGRFANMQEFSPAAIG